MSINADKLSDPLFFFGHTETGKIAKNVDWLNTSLGDPHFWPLELKITLGMLFQNRHPVCLFWGKDSNYFYNDAYIPIVGRAKHPAIMGKKGAEIWSEVWDVLLPQIDQVLSGKEATWNENQLIPILGDDGKPREAYFTYSYSPIFLGDGTIAAVLVTCTEMTARIIAEKDLIQSKLEVVNVLESMTDGYFSVDSNWIIKRVNSQHEKLTKTSRKDIIGKPFWEVFPVEHPFESSKYWVEHHRVMRERTPSHFEECYKPLGLWTGTDVYPTSDGGIAVFFRDITAQKNAERRTESERQKFEALFVSFSASIALLQGTDFRFEMANPRFLKDFGVQDVFGKYLSDAFPNFKGNDITKQMRSVFESGLTYEVEEMPLKLHVVKYFDLTLSRLNDEQGAPYGIYFHALDVTEKVIARRRLDESESKFRKLIETLPQLVWSCSPDGSCEYLSKQWMDYTGMPEHLQLGFDWMTKVLHPEDQDRTFEHWMGAVKGLNPYDIEYRLRKADGTYRWFKARGTPILDESGRTRIWFGTCTDIEDSKQAQLSFEKNVDTSPAMLWITEPDGYCSYLSHQWYENTGQTPETGLGFGWTNAAHPDERAMAGREFVEANAKRVPFRCEFRLQNKDGNYRWCIDAGNPRYDKDGRYLGMAGTVFDVHERKTAEEDAIELSKSLQTAVKARDEFLSIASHELKTPITSLKMQLQLTKRGINPELNIAPPPEKIARVVDISLKQVDRLTGLVDDLLDISRIESGKLSLNFVPVDLGSILAELIERFDEEAKAAKCEVQLIIESSLPILGDSFRLDQVFTNLLSNAIKYSPGSKIRITVKQAIDTVVVSIQDEGMGIDTNKLEAIFNRYERAIDSTKISGLGLGLYITRNILEAHRGKIEVQSQLGEGSTFTVSLPAIQ